MLPREMVNVQGANVYTIFNLIAAHTLSLAAACVLLSASL